MTRKTLITLIVLILAIICLGFFFIKPGISQIKDLRSELRVKLGELVEIEEFLDKFEVLKKQYEEGEAKLKKAEQVLPQKPDIPGILVQLETLASENGLLLEEINYSLPVTSQAGTAKEAFQKVAIDLEIAGSYKAFKGFLASVQNNLRIMDISDTTLSAQIKEVEEGTIISYTYNLTMNVYYQE